VIAVYVIGEPGLSADGRCQDRPSSAPRSRRQRLSTAHQPMPL